VLRERPDNRGSADLLMLQALCQALPFLGSLPNCLLEQLDVSTLHVPQGIVQRLRCRLEKQLGLHVMTYRSLPGKPSPCGGLHLCRLLVPADLSAQQLDLLQSAEAACATESVVLVAYKKPLELRKELT
jgi:hypothetical protein